MTWDLPVTVDIQGTVYHIRTDYRCILDIFYPDYYTMSPEHLREVVEQCLWFVGGGIFPSGLVEVRWDKKLQNTRQNPLTLGFL